MSGERRGGGGLGAAFILLAVVGVIVKFWVWIVVALGVVAFGVALGLLCARAERAAKARARAQAAIAARADEQHAQILAGDDRGIYGIYPPARPPATSLDAFVDGLVARRNFLGG